MLSMMAALATSCGGNGASVVPAVSSPPVSGSMLPCDTYFAAGTPCVAAHSTTRALFAAYNGSLYRVKRTSDNTTLDVGLLAKGDYANIAPQDAFCSGTYCTVTRIYDQTSNHNDLTIGPRGGADPADIGVPANALPVVAGGHPVYGLSFTGGMGYRILKGTNVATGGEPEGMYMVTSGTHVNDWCCFDYGNAETSATDTGNGHMDAINFGTECWFTPCAGSGPWVQADMENGLFQSDLGYSRNSSNTGMLQPFVSAWLKNDGQTKMALRAGDAQSGALTTEYAGSLPAGYMPMLQEGSIVLGIGGDNSNGSVGNFFEGVMTAGYPVDATENAVQANIVSVGYDIVTPTASIAGTLTAGAEISIELTSSGLTNYYLRHEASNGTQLVVSSQLGSSSTASDLSDATWVVRTGLADPSCFSFEARNRPGEFMRHYNFILYSQPWDGTALSAQDATFCAVTGNAGSGYSFQSKDFPAKYIRQYNGGAYVADTSGTHTFDAAANYNKDSTFLVVSPLKP
jgi:hypothetical protein